MKSIGLSLVRPLLLAELVNRARDIKNNEDGDEIISVVTSSFNNLTTAASDIFGGMLGSFLVDQIRFENASFFYSLIIIFSFIPYIILGKFIKTN